MIVNLKWSGTKAQLLEELRKILAAAAGAGPVPDGAVHHVDDMLQRPALAVRDAAVASFEVKKKGADDLGTQWQPLAPATIKRKRRRKSVESPETIGVDQGRMQKSFEVKVVAPGKSRALNSAPYASHFDDGTSNMVARPIFPDPVPPLWTHYAVEALREAVQEAIADLCNRGPK